MNQEQLLKELGLSPKEARIYQLMLTLGKVRAKDVKKQLDMPRATVYEILANLVEKGLLLEELDKSNITVYQAKHPYALKDYVEGKKQKLDQTEAKLDSIFNDFVSLYSQNQTRPGVKFYEGKKGVWKALKDTLSSKTEILTIADIEAANTFIKEENEKYIALRNKKGIKKRLLAIDNEYSRLRYKDRKDLIDVRLLKIDILPFNTSLQLYDNKIAYITMNDEHLTSTIINNQFIYSMHTSLFELMWKQAELL